MIYVKQNTATTVIFGPLLSFISFSAVGHMTLPASEFLISKNGASHVAKNSSTASIVAGIFNGLYKVHLNETDTNTLGSLNLTHFSYTVPHILTALDITVLNAQTYDAMFTTTGTVKADIFSVRDVNVTTPDDFKADVSDLPHILPAIDQVESLSTACLNEVSKVTNTITIDSVHGNYFTAQALKEAPITTHGAITAVYTVTDSGTSDPIADTLVWVTTDINGNSVIGSGTTDNFGKVTFYLDAGTYYFWRKKAGYNFVNPDTEVIA